MYEYVLPLLRRLQRHGGLRREKSRLCGSETSKPCGVVSVCTVAPTKPRRDWRSQDKIRPRVSASSARIGHVSPSTSRTRQLLMLITPGSRIQVSTDTSQLPLCGRQFSQRPSQGKRRHKKMLGGPFPCATPMQSAVGKCRQTLRMFSELPNCGRGFARDAGCQNIITHLASVDCMSRIRGSRFAQRRHRQP